MKSLPSVFLALLSLVLAQVASAGSATWKGDPTSDDWFTASNWTPETVPNGPSDTATFDVSNTTDLSVSGVIEVDSIAFNPGANSFSLGVLFTGGPFSPSLTFSGAGIINNSAVMQSFIGVVNGLYAGDIYFTNSATAGSHTSFLNSGGFSSSVGATVQFLDDSNAGNATFVNEDANYGSGGNTLFFDDSSAGSAVFKCEGGAFPGYFFGGEVIFYDFSTAGNGDFVADGARAKNASGGAVAFSGSPTAADATLIANGGTNGGSGGRILFRETSQGGRARVELFGNGSLDLVLHGAPGITIGSLEGDGLVLLGSNNLTIGSSNLNTAFAGVIENSGSVTKIGRGTLVLTGANTYTGGTTVNGGKLVVSNRSGSGTGSGALQVNAGRLRGRGTIAGAVILGTGSGTGAVLSPGEGRARPHTLTIQSTLTFNSDATYNFGLNSKTTIVDKVVANGVTISSGAQFSFAPFGGNVLTAGTVFTAIDNTATTPIAGTFSNLADGSTLTVGSNTFQADYEGGDGNDLTLTVVP